MVGTATNVDPETGVRIRRRMRPEDDVDPTLRAIAAWRAAHPGVQFETDTNLPANPGERIRFYEAIYGPEEARQYRSRMIFMFIVQGMTTLQIMQRVNRSKPTVERWRRQMREDLVDTWRTVDPLDLHAQYMAMEEYTDGVLAREMAAGDRVNAVRAYAAKKRVLMIHLRHLGFYDVANPFSGVRDDGRGAANTVRRYVIDAFEGADAPPALPAPGEDREDAEDVEDDEGLYDPPEGDDDGYDDDD